MGTKNYFLINPAAGNGAKQKKLGGIKSEAAQRNGAEYKLYYTGGVGDAKRYIENICRENKEDKLRFYVCGGDGTFNEGINGAAGYENAAIGIVPVGTGNDFVKNFTNTYSFLDIDAQLQGSTVTVDGLMYNGRLCGNMFNIGFDCAVVVKVRELKNNPLIPNSFSYGAGVLECLVKMPGVSAKITLDGVPVKEGDMLLCTVANGGYCGGGYHSNPLASVTDGIIDVCLIGRVTRLKLLEFLGMYKKGSHLCEKTKSFISCKKCKNVRFDFGVPTDICVDGEVERYEYLDVTVSPGALRIICPEGSCLKKIRCQQKSDA